MAGFPKVYNPKNIFQWMIRRQMDRQPLNMYVERSTYPPENTPYEQNYDGTITNTN